MEDFKLIWELAKSLFAEHAGFGLISAVLCLVLWYCWRWTSLTLARIKTLETAWFGGGAYFQKDAQTGIITYANPALAALLGNKHTVKEIVGRTVGQIFERHVVDALLDLDDRLSRRDEVVENNVAINGNPCTIAKRRTANGDYWFVQVHIHRQDRVFTA